MESFGYGRGLYAKAYDSDGEGFREERLEKMLGGEKNFEEILKDPRMNKLLVFNKSDRSGTKRNFLFVNVTQESGRKEFAKAVKAISDSGKEEITVNLRLDDEK